MKKAFFFTVMAFVLSAAVFAQSATIDTALAGAKAYIEAQVPSGAKVLISDLTASAAAELGSYIGQELSSRLVNGKRVTVVERSAAVMQSLAAETGYQLSGEVSDDSIQSIGYKTGAEILITGSVSGSGERYRMNLKITSVKTAELLGQYSVFFQTDSVLNALLAHSKPQKVKPAWIDEPLSVRGKYENSSSGVSSWYYDVGISNKTTSEQLARTRARQNIQQMTAENIGSNIRARTDISSLSMFQSSGVEDAELRIEAVISNSIKTKIPRFETLEWYIETGKTDGKDWYMAYVLVRFPRSDILTMVEKIDVRAIADTAARQLNISSDADKALLLQELGEARDYSLDMIREGFYK